MYRIDLALPRWRIAIECDGVTVHGQPTPIYRDRWRANRINNDQWHVYRFTWWDVHNRPAYIITTIRNAIRMRQQAG